MERYYSLDLFKPTLAGAIMKYFILVITFLTCAKSFSADYEFHAFFEKEGFITERLLPFSVKSTLPGEFTLSAIEVLPPCYGMVDLHRPNLALIYCTEASLTKFEAKIIKDGVTYKLLSPEFEVKKVAIVSSTPKPDVGPTKTLGHKLFDVNCKKCHQSPYQIGKGVTKTHLTEAFAGRAMRNGKTTNAMKDFNGFFNSSEQDALVKYINEEL
jgi:cytochrome c5